MKELEKVKESGMKVWMNQKSLPIKSMGICTWRGTGAAPLVGGIGGQRPGKFFEF